MTQGIYIDNIVARIILENVVMYFYAGRSASLDNLDSIHIIPEHIIVVGDSIIARYGFLVYSSSKVLKDKASQGETFSIDCDSHCGGTHKITVQNRSIWTNTRCS